MLSASGANAWLQLPDRISVPVPFIDPCVYRLIINCDPILQTISCLHVIGWALQPLPGHSSTGELTMLPRTP